MHAFTRLATEVTERYSAASTWQRESAYPFVVATLPLAIASMLVPGWLLCVLVALTLVVLYQVGVVAEATLFAVTRAQAHLGVTMPLCGLLSAWGVALGAIGRSQVMLGVVGPYSLAVLLVCAPAYRIRESRRSRRIPLAYTYPFVALLAWIASVASLGT